MKVTLNELQRGFVSLGKLANQDMRLKVADQLGRIAKAAESEMKNLEDLRIKLIKRIGNEDAEGNYTVPADAMEAFTAEMTELLDVSVELPGERIKLDSLPDGVRLSAIDLINLDWLLEAEAEKTATEKSNVASA